MNTPSKLKLFIDLVSDKLYYNEDSDNIIVLDEPDLLKSDLVRSEIDQLISFLKRKGIISKSNTYTVGKDADLLPIKYEDKVRRLRWSFWEIFSGENFKYRYAIEIASRDALLKFQQEAFVIPEKPMAETVMLKAVVVPTKSILSFDDERSILNFMGQSILISKKTDKTNAYYVLKYIFDNPDGISVQNHYSEIHDALGDRGKPYSWKIYHRACSDIQEKVRKGTPEKIEDFLIFKSGTTGWVQINPVYITK